MQRALVNSFGFGGKNIVIAVSRVDVPVGNDVLVHEGVGVYHQPLATPAMARSRHGESLQGKP
jgi:hypothetical protein